MQDEKRQPSPRVSVLIPAYNAQRYLEQAVRSVQAQTVTDLEILILDDGSQDDTANIAGKLMDKEAISIKQKRGMAAFFSHIISGRKSGE